MTATLLFPNREIVERATRPLVRLLARHVVVRAEAGQLDARQPALQNVTRYRQSMLSCARDQNAPRGGKLDRGVAGLEAALPLDAFPSARHARSDAEDEREERHQDEGRPGDAR